MEPEFNEANGETIGGDISRASAQKPSLVLIAVFLIVTALAVYFYFEARALEQNPNKTRQEKVAALVQRVEKLIDLPKGEIPSTATILDPTPLVGNPFFARAQAGHEVLFYTESSKAFLYDPVNNIIVEVATIVIGP